MRSLSLLVSIFIAPYLAAADQGDNSARHDSIALNYVTVSYIADVLPRFLEGKTKANIEITRVENLYNLPDPIRKITAGTIKLLIVEDSNSLKIVSSPKDFQLTRETITHLDTMVKMQCLEEMIPIL